MLFCLFILLIFQKRCKITAFLAHTQLFLIKNATNFRQNVTKNRLLWASPTKKTHPKMRFLTI